MAGVGSIFSILERAKGSHKFLMAGLGSIFSILERVEGSKN